jgi:hypothetical protein
MAHRNSPFEEIDKKASILAQEMEKSKQAEIRARLRDVAEANGNWRGLANYAETTFAERVAQRWQEKYIVAALGYAIFYRGLLSLCEVE